LLPKRRRNSHKGSYGKTAIVGGSARYSGAPYLSATAALRGGAGYVTLFLPERMLPYYYLKSPELLLESVSAGEEIAFEEEYFEKLLSYDSVAFGMGAGISEEVAKGAAYLVENYTGKLVLDADGLNSLAKYAKSDVETLFANKKCDVIVTPHIKEFSRMSERTATEILSESAKEAKAFAEKYQITVLLKNATSVITDGRRTAYNVTGNSGQAKAGSGDVLSGLIASLCAEGLSSFEAGAVGAYLCGKSAEIAAKKTGEYSLLASDVVAKLGEAFLEL
jgi:NAD(P)H-hydrate epimerase